MSELREQVLAFHRKFGQSIGETPHVPSDDVVRFRLNLIAEEFVELLDASVNPTMGCRLDEVREAIKSVLEYPLEVDLPTFIDATHDLDYVTEGTRITFGIDGGPTAAEVQRANMDKIPAVTGDRYGGVGAKIVRPAKPEGWKPPDIIGELVKQGYKP